MMPIVYALLGFVVGMVRSRIGLQLEIVALRHQLAVYERTIRRPPRSVLLTGSSKGAKVLRYEDGTTATEVHETAATMTS